MSNDYCLLFHLWILLLLLSPFCSSSWYSAILRSFFSCDLCIIIFNLVKNLIIYIAQFSQLFGSLTISSQSSSSFCTIFHNTPVICTICTILSAKFNVAQIFAKIIIEKLNFSVCIIILFCWIIHDTLYFLLCKFVFFDLLIVTSH